MLWTLVPMGVAGCSCACALLVVIASLKMDPSQRPKDLMWPGERSEETKRGFQDPLCWQLEVRTLLYVSKRDKSCHIILMRNKNIITRVFIIWDNFGWLYKRMPTHALGVCSHWNICPNFSKTHSRLQSYSSERVHLNNWNKWININLVLTWSQREQAKRQCHLVLIPIAQKTCGIFPKEASLVVTKRYRVPKELD